jgi:hypothetical protein
VSRASEGYSKHARVVRIAYTLSRDTTKYINKIEFVAELKNVRQGKGGYWEDQGYEWFAGI